MTIVIVEILQHQIEVEQLFNGSIYSNKNFITVIPNSLLDKILSFYISFKKLLSNNKNYKCLIYFQYTLL